MLRNSITGYVWNKYSIMISQEQAPASSLIEFMDAFAIFPSSSLPAAPAHTTYWWFQFCLQAALSQLALNSLNIQ